MKKFTILLCCILMVQLASGKDGTSSNFTMVGKMRDGNIFHKIVDRRVDKSHKTTIPNSFYYASLHSNVNISLNVHLSPQQTYRLRTGRIKHMDILISQKRSFKLCKVFNIRTFLTFNTTHTSWMMSSQDVLYANKSWFQNNIKLNSELKDNRRGQLTLAMSLQITGILKTHFSSYAIDINYWNNDSSELMGKGDILFGIIERYDIMRVEPLFSNQELKFSFAAPLLMMNTERIQEDTTANDQKDQQDQFCSCSCEYDPIRKHPESQKTYSRKMEFICFKDGVPLTTDETLKIKPFTEDRDVCMGEIWEITLFTNVSLPMLEDDQYGSYQCALKVVFRDLDPNRPTIRTHYVLSNEIIRIRPQEWKLQAKGFKKTLIQKNLTVDKLEEDLFLKNMIVMAFLLMFISIICYCVRCWFNHFTKKIRKQAQIEMLDQLFELADVNKKADLKPSVYKYDVFISYSSHDKKWVEDILLEFLEKDHVYKVCFDRRDFHCGKSDLANIATAIKTSRKTLAIMSPNYIKSRWCNEVEFVMAYTRMIENNGPADGLLVIKLEPCNLPELLLRKIYLDWTDESCRQYFWPKLLAWLGKPSVLPDSDFEEESD